MAVSDDVAVSNFRARAQWAAQRRESASVGQRPSDNGQALSGSERRRGLDASLLSEVEAVRPSIVKIDRGRRGAGEVDLQVASVPAAHAGRVERTDPDKGLVKASRPAL
jgi:hypothetical protein